MEDIKHVLIAYVVPLLVYGAITGLLNLMLAERSRIDAWAETHPKLAGALKLMRAVGFDPWHVVSAVSLWAKGRLPKGQKGEIPPPPKPPVGLIGMLCIALVLLGCSSNPDPCDPVIFDARSKAMAAECRMERKEKCQGYAEQSECPAVQACFDRLDKLEESCRGR